jgi:hypothetical protein
VQGFLVSRPIAASTVPLFLSHASDHLKTLANSVPTPQDTDTSSRLRVLRMSSPRTARRSSSGSEDM